MSPPPQCLRSNPQCQPLTQIGHLAPVTQPSRGELLLRLPHPPQRPLDPWTFLLDEWLNVPEGEMVWKHYLHAVGVDLDSRVQSAI
jgi:hypothetical protein